MLQKERNLPMSSQLPSEVVGSQLNYPWEELTTEHIVNIKQIPTLSTDKLFLQR